MLSYVFILEEDHMVFNLAACCGYPSVLSPMGCGVGGIFFNGTPPLFENKRITQKQPSTVFNMDLL